MLRSACALPRKFTRAASDSLRQSILRSSRNSEVRNFFFDDSSKTCWQSDESRQSKSGFDIKPTRATSRDQKGHSVLLRGLKVLKSITD